MFVIEMRCDVHQSFLSGRTNLIFIFLQAQLHLKITVTDSAFTS